MPATGRSVNIDLDAGETVTCTFTNTRQAPPSNGTIIIVKDSVPNDPQDFSFTYNFSSGSATLDDDPSSTTPNSFTVQNVAAGTYSVGESQVAGWSLSSIACNDTLAGQDGSDTLTGGTGADNFNGGSGTDTATDFTPAQGDSKTSVENT